MYEVFRGLNDSMSLLAFRVGSIKLIYRILIMFMVAGVFIAIYLSTFTGELVLTLLAVPTIDSPAAESVNNIKQYIAIYLSLYTSGDLNLFVTVSVALLLGSIVFVPFSGYIIHGVVSSSEMTTIKNGDHYRIGDSILFQFVSSFTFIQLVGLTVVTELLTIDAVNPGLATVFVWITWIALTLLTSLLAWVVEYASRKFGKVLRFSILIGLIVLVGLVVLADPTKATTLFGAAGPIFDFIQTLAGPDGFSLFLSGVAVVACVVVLAIIGIGRVASKTLELAELPSVSKERRTRERRTVAVPTRFGYTSMLLNLLFRYPTVVRPIMTSTVFSIIIALVLSGSTAITTTLIVLPLAVGISYGANMFGLFGNSNNYLLSLPGFRSTILYRFAAVLSATIFVIYGVVYGAAMVAGKIDAAELFQALPAMVGVTSMVVLISIFFTASNPLPFSAKVRENVVSSPLILIGYVSVYIFGTSFIGNLPNVVRNDPGTSWTIAGILVLLAVGGFFLIQRKWTREEKWSMKVLTKTVNAG